MLTNCTLLAKIVTNKRLNTYRVVFSFDQHNRITVKNAVLVTSRILAFGANYPISMVDKYTGENVEVNVDLSQIQIKEIDDNLLNRKNEFSCSLY